jgi:tetratricopeptide (TPR) repeat protein
LTSRILRRAAVAALSLGFVLSLAACSSKEGKLAEHLERAKEFEEAGQTKEALLELRSALQLDPKNADVNFRIAEQMAESGDYANAMFFYRETVRLDPTRTDAALAEAKLVLFDDTGRAEELVAQVLALEPKNGLAYVRRSEAALARNDTAGALQAALTAAELDPNNGLAHMQLGIVGLARIREAAIKGEAPPASLFTDAERAYKRAAELFPKGHHARVELGRLYAIWEGHGDQAEAAYRSAIEVAQTNNARARSADAAISFARVARRPELLRFGLETLVTAEPQNLNGWDELARLEESREKGAGDAVYQRLFEARPDDIEAHIHYADFLNANERSDAAYAHLEKQAEQGVKADVVLEQIVAMRLRDGDLDQARAALDRLTKQAPTSPRTDLAKARIALAEGRLDEASEILRRYLGIEDTAEGQRLLAMAEVRRGQFPAAIAAVDRALQLDYDERADLLRLKTTIHANAGDHSLVIQTLNRLNSEAGSLRPAEKVMLAQSLYTLGRRPAGRGVLEDLLASEDPPIGAYLEFARYEQRREPKRALEYLAKALEMQPNNPQALRIMAQVDLRAGKPQEALARIDKAAEAGPLPPALLLLRAQVLASMQDWPKAEEEARRAFAAAPNLPGALELLASIYVAQQRVDEAIVSFEEAEKAGALPPSGQQLLARLYLTAGRNADAKALYEKVIAARADLPGAKNDLAWLLALDGTQVERALTLAQEAQQAEPESAEVADTLGYVYLKKGLHDPALQQFKYALELAQRDEDDASVERPEYHYHMGLALQALGRAGEAAPAFERALALDGQFAGADDARRQLEAAKAGGGPNPG